MPGRQGFAIHVPVDFGSEGARRLGEEARAGYIALSGKVVIILTNQPDELSDSGLLFGFKKRRAQWDEVTRLADLVYSDFVNASVHMKILLEALEELRQ